MNKIKVAVIFGGTSTEHEISKMSAATIISNLSRDRYFVIPVYITKDGRWLLYDGIVENLSNVEWEKHGTPVVLSPDISHRGFLRLVGEKAKNIPVDIIFPVLHGKNGEDGSIQGLCQLAMIPYVGAGVLSSAVCMDKTFTKIIVNSLNIAQAEYITVMKKELSDMDVITKKIRYKIGYPCFIKPANAGSSVGISRASNKAELEKGLTEAASRDRKIIVEKMVNGRELECAVLGNDAPEASGVGEIIPSADFYDYDAKYGGGDSKTITNPQLSEEIVEKIRQHAISIYKALDCKGMARVDFFYDEEKNKVIFNEINTIPGFTAISMYPKLWQAANLDIDKLIDKLIYFGINEAKSASL